MILTTVSPHRPWVIAWTVEGAIPCSRVGQGDAKSPATIIIHDLSIFYCKPMRGTYRVGVTEGATVGPVGEEVMPVVGAMEGVRLGAIDGLPVPAEVGTLVGLVGGPKSCRGAAGPQSARRCRW
jgi:hypothetical protein